jgi:hypothetical protein
MGSSRNTTRGPQNTSLPTVTDDRKQPEWMRLLASIRLGAPTAPPTDGALGPYDRALPHEGTVT